MTDQTLVEYEMGYLDSEFGTVLRGPFTGDKSGYRCIEIESNHWQVEQSRESFQLEISIAVQAPRKLGMLSLPVLQVKFTFIDTERLLREKFFHRFHQYFHKGGG